MFCFVFFSIEEKIDPVSVLLKIIYCEENINRALGKKINIGGLGTIAQVDRLFFHRCRDSIHSNRKCRELVRVI